MFAPVHLMVAMAVIEQFINFNLLLTYCVDTTGHHVEHYSTDFRPASEREIELSHLSKLI